MLESADTTVVLDNNGEVADTDANADYESLGPLGFALGDEDSGAGHSVLRLAFSEEASDWMSNPLLANSRQAHIRGVIIVDGIEIPIDGMVGIERIQG